MGGLKILKEASDSEVQLNSWKPRSGWRKVVNLGELIS